MLALQLTSAQLVEWQAFETLEPIGGIAADFRAGMLINAALAPHRERGAQVPQPLDFFPWHHAPANEPLELDPDAQVAAFDRIFPNR
ncbi:MAG: hypothetical protein IPM64_17575 [Phycisphaerales bacterium]|nr:hypothetical protein [Phycisphaerales bacterium]